MNDSVPTYSLLLSYAFFLSLPPLSFPCSRHLSLCMATNAQCVSLPVGCEGGGAGGHSGTADVVTACITIAAAAVSSSANGKSRYCMVSAGVCLSLGQEDQSHSPFFFLSLTPQRYQDLVLHFRKVYRLQSILRCPLK